MGTDDSQPEGQSLSEALFTMFAPATQEQWRQLVVSEFGGSFEQKLIAHTYEDIDLQPLYWPQDAVDLPFVETLPGETPLVRGTQRVSPQGATWRICQAISAAPAAEANRLAVQALAQGARALRLAPNDPQSLIDTLRGIEQPDLFLLITAEPTQSYELTQTLARIFDPQRLHGLIGSDPLAAIAAGTAIERERTWQAIAQVTIWAAQHAPNVATIAADGNVYYEAGASAVQELAFTLASAVEQVRQLTEQGVPAALSGPRVQFCFALGTQIFMEIAKLRAARLLWSKVMLVWGVDPETAPAIIHAQSGLRTFTLADPHTNLLRATTQAFAAIIGGCTSLQITPFDAASTQPDDFSRRLTLNTQHLLAEESLLGHVIDPAGGSWYVETLTDAVAHKAWDLFQDVERQGGLSVALDNGWPQQQIGETSAKRANRIATRRDILVGTNMYANPLEEQPLTQPQSTATQPASPIGSILRPYRDAEPYEALRARTQLLPPQAFLANIGPASQHRSRADFALGLLHIVGIAVIDNPGFATPELAAQAAIQSSAPIVVICSSDTAYPTIVPPFVQLVRAARPAALIVLAGLPGEQAELLRSAGIDLFIHARADAIATLHEILTRIGL